MKKKMLIRSLCGLSFGLALEEIIAIVISLVKNEGAFQAVIPQLVNDFGGELNAVLLQTILYAAFGALLGAATIIWEMDSWSLTKQTITHFLVFALPFILIAYILYWIPRSALGVLSAVAVFIAIYAGIWGLVYFSCKRKVEKINAKLYQNASTKRQRSK